MKLFSKNGIHYSIVSVFVLMGCAEQETKLNTTSVEAFNESVADIKEETTASDFKKIASVIYFEGLRGIEPDVYPFNSLHRASQDAQGFIDNNDFTRKGYRSAVLSNILSGSVESKEILLHGDTSDKLLQKYVIISEAVSKSRIKMLKVQERNLSRIIPKIEVDIKKFKDEIEEINKSIERNDNFIIQALKKETEGFLKSCEGRHRQAEKHLIKTREFLEKYKNSNEYVALSYYDDGGGITPRLERQRCDYKSVIVDE